MPVSETEADDLEHYLADFRRDGFLVVRGLFSRQRTDELLTHLHRLYPRYLDGDLPDDHFEVGNRRFTAPLRFEPPFDCADFVAHPLLDALLSAFLGLSYVIEAFGVVASLPGAEDQQVHRDGGPLFPDSGVDGLLPPSAMTVAMPLVDMDETSGRTKFWPGSQRQAKRDKEAAGMALDTPAGSLAMWDFRTFHAGEANRSERARPMLYFTACRPFWMDHRNFVPGKNAKLQISRASLDALDENVRARFVRAEVLD